MKTGKNVIIKENCVIREDVVLGDNVEVKAAVHLANGLRVGDNTTLGPSCMTLEKTPDGQNKGVTIGSNCYISAGAILLPGVVIGDNVVVGAGSVVTKDCIEPGLYLGIPAKKVEKRNYHLGQYSIIDEDVTIGKDVWIGNYVHIRPRVLLSDGCDIRDYCFIAEGAQLGENTRCGMYANVCANAIVGSEVYIGSKAILTNDKTIDPKWKGPKTYIAPVIEDEVRIGVAAVILPGVRLGKGSKIGAGAVVAHDTEPGVTYVGVPARAKRGKWIESKDAKETQVLAF